MTNPHLVGKYRLVRVLGRGTMGELWAAVDTDTDRDVALKLITGGDLEGRRRLFREARAVGQVVHPNIVQVLDQGRSEAGVPFLVMQLLEGETVAERLHRLRALPQHVAAGVAFDAARALGAAHDRGIVHGDLKPANIFLHRQSDTKGYVVKVVGFGASTRSVYTSPEQVTGSDVDGRADLWALGAVLFEMLSGVRPFGAPSQAIPRVEGAGHGIDHALGDVVAACLEREPARRIGTAAELCRRLGPFTGRRQAMAASLPERRVSAMGTLLLPPTADVAPGAPPSPDEDEDEDEDDDMPTEMAFSPRQSDDDDDEDEDMPTEMAASPRQPDDDEDEDEDMPTEMASFAVANSGERSRVGATAILPIAAMLPSMPSGARAEDAATPSAERPRFHTDTQQLSTVILPVAEVLGLEVASTRRGAAFSPWVEGAGTAETKGTPARRSRRPGVIVGLSGLAVLVAAVVVVMLLLRSSNVAAPGASGSPTNVPASASVP